MTVERFYPSLSDLVSAEALPEELGFLHDAASDVFDGLFYRNLQAHVSPAGDQGDYRLILVSYKTLGFSIPGTDFVIRLNPLASGGEGTEIPVALSYSWEILRYTNRVDLSQFDFSPRAFFGLLLEVAGVNYSDLIQEIVETFIGGTLDDFVMRFNTVHADTPLVVAPDADSAVFIDNIVDALDAHALDVLDVLFDDYLAAADVPTSIANVERLFAAWLGFFSVERLRRMLVPEVAASIDTIAIGIQIPSAVLREVDAAGAPVPDVLNASADKPVIITCDAASLSYSTRNGLVFDLADSAVLTVPPAELLRSGLILDIHAIKLDLSRTTSIPEAIADGRPDDFIGVYVKDGTISFPAFWNQEPGSTAVIKARDVLLGTGGVSGTLALEAKTAGAASPVVGLRLGDGFKISLDQFRLTFKQDAITDSVIEGTLEIPGFEDGGAPAKIRIKAAIRGDGDFDITAHEEQGSRRISFPGVFDVHLHTVLLGRKDDDFYLGVSGNIEFTHSLLGGIASQPIEVEKLLIWSDGRFEIEGGTLPLPKNIRFPIGPAELTISAIHLGSHQEPGPGGMTTFRYFGFDGGIDVNPGGVDIRGKGVKFYFPTNGDLSLCFLEIKSLAIDLVIPGTASKETATLLVSGFLSVARGSSGPEYQGGVAFALPKMKIAGGASMRYAPRDPAFLVDAFVELSAPIPLGATSLGIFGFRGLFGQRYIATKSAAGLPETAAWFDYYKADVEGINVGKFEEPIDTAGYDSTLSIGAGLSLATAADSGKAFSSRLFLLLSLPDLIYLEGRANIVGERVGLTGNDDPPFLAVLAITPQSLEIGAGVRYDLPRKDPNQGQILSLNAEMRAAFFFRNASAWYVNIGTPQNPTTARILSLFDATSYLMLSASGIAAGAGVTFGFDKSYAGGLVRASVHVYIKVGGFISFERPQIGGFAMLGGSVDIAFMWLRLRVVLDTVLSVEVPRPFYVQGRVHLCVGVTIGFWKFKKTIERCFDVEFKWLKDPTVDRQPVLPISNLAGLPPASATNMLSGETFDIASFGETPPPPDDARFDKAVVPLDTWIDIEFLKGLLPLPAVDARIGRLSGDAPSHATEAIPPAEVAHKVNHQYSIRALEISAWNGTQWVEYRPYQAMSPPAALAALAADPMSFKDGFWINQGGGFNKVRLLAETSLSHMQQAGWYVPEEFGVSGASLFCRGEVREESCIDWIAVDAGTQYPAEKWTQIRTLLYRITGGPGTVVRWAGFDGPQNSLLFANEDVAQLVFTRPCGWVRLRVTTYAPSVTIHFYKRDLDGAGTGYTLVGLPCNLNQTQLLAPVLYDDPDTPIAKIEIVPMHANATAIERLQVEIWKFRRILLERPGDDDTGRLRERIIMLTRELKQLKQAACDREGIRPDSIRPHIVEIEGQLAECEQELAAVKSAQSQACRDVAKLRDRFERCFPAVPSRISYEVAEEENGRFGFVIYDDETDAVLRRSTTLLDSASAAKVACFELLLSLGIPEIPIRRVGGKLPCPECLGHLECWSELQVPGALGIQVSPRELICDVYARLYRSLYGQGRKELDELTNRCDDLTRAMQKQRATCRALNDQLAAALDALSQTESTGPLRPPPGFSCSTLVHQVCWLSREDYELNRTIPDCAAIERDYASAEDAIASRLTPVWRPHLKYTIRVEVQDTVDSDPKPSRSFYFGFRTGGPVGYFHNDEFADYVKNGKPDRHLLTGLKGYIDYGRSYPNADGELIRAKPLFYEDARILLFFTKRYTYHLFGDWPAYQGLPALTGNAMEIVIKDPAEKPGVQNPPPPHVITTEIPRTAVSWPVDDNPRIPEDVRTLLTMRNPQLLNDDFAGVRCWRPGGESITPASVHAHVEPHNLRPLKLYTAIVNNLHTVIGTNGPTRHREEVHRFVFQTSRYPDFRAQVNSYHLEDVEGNARDAIFRVEVPLTFAEVNTMYDIVSGTMSTSNAALAGRWADPFDRIVEGLMSKLPPLDAAVSSEFNVVVNESTGVPIAVWLRCNEPFNDPKLPANVLAGTLQVIQGSNLSTAYRVLFSKDGAQALVMHPAKSIPAAKLKFRFAYAEWDGAQYVNRTIVTTPFIPIYV